MTGKPLFPGKNEFDQISRIHSILGTPSEEITSLFMKNPNTNIELSFKYQKGRGLKAIFPKASNATLDLLAKMLVYNPEERISVHEALNHKVFEVIRDSEELWGKIEYPIPFPEFAIAQMRRATRKLSASSKIEIKPLMKQTKFVVNGASSSLKGNKNSTGIPTVKVPCANQSIKESRRVAAERIKKYKMAHTKDIKQTQQKKHGPSIHLGPAKIIQNASISVSLC